MRTISLMCGIVAAVLVAGCGNNSIRPSTFDVPPTAFVCDFDTDCVVTVSVTSTNPCRIAIDRSDLSIKGSSTLTGRKHLIRWELDEPSVDAKFRFDPSNGVVLKKPDPDGQFSDQGIKGGGLQYHWRNKNTNYFVYEYAINIVQKGTANRCTLDPRMFNN